MDQIWNPALYARTSSDDDQTQSIETQQHRLRQWSINDPLVNKARIGEFWDANVSGAIPLSKRPAGNRLLESIADGMYNCIAVVYADRFARDLLSGLQAAAVLERQNVKLITIDEGWDSRKESDPFFFQMRLLFADAERKRIVKRFRDGKERSMDKRNVPPTGILTFGYRINETGQYVIFPEEAAIVLEVFERYLRGESQREIRHWFEEIGVVPGRRFQRRAVGSQPTISKVHLNARIYDTKVRYILKNRTYIGERRWKERVFPCPAIISEPIFESVQRGIELRRDGRTTFRDGRAGLRSDVENGILSGLMTCSLCGSRVYARNRKNKQHGKIYRYRKYVCQGSVDTKINCKCKIIDQPKMDSAVWDIAKTHIWDAKKLLEQVSASESSLSKNKQDLQLAEESFIKKSEQIAQQTQEIWLEQRKRNLPISFIMPQLEILNGELKQAQKELKTLRHQQQKWESDQTAVRELQEQLIEIREWLRRGPTAIQKRHILELMIAEAIIETYGSGHKKRGQLKLCLRWGEKLTPENARDAAIA